MDFKNTNNQTLILQDRDREIILFLRSQGVATFRQLLELFFKNKENCSRRLNQLIENNILEQSSISKNLKSLKNSKFLPINLELKLKPHSKIYHLSNIYRNYFCENARLSLPNMTIHQLILNDVRKKIKYEFNQSQILNDIDIHFEARGLSNTEPLVPDLVFKSKEYNIAVEVERTAKSKIKYRSRMARYNSSQFTCVLYFYTKENIFDALLECSGPFRKIGFIDYFRPNEVYSKFWGKLSYHEFIQKVSNFTQESHFKPYQF